MEIKYSHRAILLAIFLGCLQICSSTQGVTNQDGACFKSNGYLGGNYYGTAPFCEGKNPNHKNCDPNDGSWDKYYFSYGEKGKKPYTLNKGKKAFGDECWSGTKYKECFAYYDVPCSTMCSRGPRENWYNYKKSEVVNVYEIMGYTPPGLFPILTGQYMESNLPPPDFDWPYIVGAHITNGPYKTSDGQDHNGNYLNYCWCNFPQLHYDDPIPDTTIKGAKAVNMDNPQYNINSIKSAMDWCSSQPMAGCQAILAQRIKPSPLQFLAMKTNETAASTVGKGLSAEDEETYEYSYVRRAASNPKATVTNRLHYLAD